MPAGYSMVELESLTGVTRWTLYSWRKQGIFPPASGGRGQLAYYTDDHLKRIREIELALHANRITIADLRERYAPEGSD